MAREEIPWAKHVRWILGVFNLFFILIGGALMGLGIWILVESDDYLDAFDEGNPFGVSILAIVIGALIILLSFFGCIGAFAKNRYLLIVYLGLMLFVVLGQVVLIVVSLHFKDKAKENVSDELMEAMTKYHTDDDVMEDLDSIQKDLECCGRTDYKDWKDTVWYRKTHGLFPTSCCKTVATGCNENVINAYQVGCVAELSDWTEDKMIILFSVSIAMLIFQVFGLIVGVILLRMTPMEEEDF